MKIGVLGGTFNPIHNGHLELARSAMFHCGLDQVWIMPAGNPYMKNASEIVDGEHRLRMVELAIEGLPGFSACTMELFDDKPTYSFQTFSTLNAEYPEDTFYFILGADSLFNLERWREPQVLCDCCKFIVSTRDLPDMSRLKEHCDHLKECMKADIYLLPFMNLDISSSHIRELLSRGESISGLVPDGVLNYIEEKGLYR